jgi:hypothetical protein
VGDAGGTTRTINGMSVSPEAFRAWMQPHVSALREFASAVDAVPERHGNLPAATSHAMSEIAEEQTYRKRSGWEHPATDTHMLGGATLRAASDSVHGIAGLFASEHPPLYAHLTLARAALESSVICAWLSEVAITTEERIKRGLCEMLYSAEEARRLEIPATGPNRVPFWTGIGESLEWKVENPLRGKPAIDGQRRPRISSGIADLADVDLDLGNTLYSLLSAVDHVTWFGLITAFDTGSAQRDERTGTAAVPIGVDSAKVSTILLWVIRLVAAAANARFTLMGWRDQIWRDAAGRAEALQAQLLQIATSGRAETP